jgi:hypothetical protein
LLQGGDAIGQREHVEERFVVSGQLEPVAPAHPRGIVDSDIPESKILQGVLLVQFASALVQAAADQHTLASAIDHVARAGDAAVGAVEGEFHEDLRNSVVQPQGIVGAPLALWLSTRGPFICSPPVRVVA